MELNLRFSSVNQVVVKGDRQETDTIDFTSPLTEDDLKDIQWYLETYSNYYTSDPDDKRAQRLEANLETWGIALFESVFATETACKIFNDFQNKEDKVKLLTIAAGHPNILSLPWELLRHPKGTYLAHHNPRISVRRRLAETSDEQKLFRIKPKEKIRILFVTSRPKGAGFIDPRAEAIPVLEAIAAQGKDRIEVEFLRPATLSNLIERLSNTNLPSIDIFHFDGHGIYDKDGRLYQQAKITDPKLQDSALSEQPNMGYLLFEDDGNNKALITAETLGKILTDYGVGITVLSACQSAKVAGEDPMGSVAARLTHCGISAVLAMTHSVLVTAATQLFSQFYGELVQGKGVGEALDNARLDLYRHRFRLEKWYGDRQVKVNLQDWFLPALYQVGEDAPLLTYDKDERQIVEEKPTQNTNLPQVQKSGFWGRSRELWDIERWFVQGKERITISGFGGQGKTYLAQEAGRWLYRTKMFQQVCFVDYAAFQGIDGLSYAIAVLNEVWRKNFVNADAVQEYLQSNQDLSSLIILDNLEALEQENLQTLLSTVKVWSEVGNCRLILTTRQGDLQLSGYETRSIAHKKIALDGLSQEDAVNYFNALVKLSSEPEVPLPSREVLIAVFQKVRFHPLSIGLLAQQLKVRRYIDVAQRLGEILLTNPENPLLASLQLSLDRLDAKAKVLLPRLGVFQGGAFEDDLLAITEIEEDVWRELRDSLVATGLITLEHLPNIGVPYVRFHPTLAPAVWDESFGDSSLTSSERAALIEQHRERYYALSRYLYFEDSKNPFEARAIAMRELPNLLYGVKGALAAEAEYAVEFVECVCKFLDFFGMRGDRQQLMEVTQTIGVVGSEQWYLAQSNLGEQLWGQGKLQEAATIFSEILEHLGEEPSYRRCLTLGHLGRCFGSAGQAAQAAELYRQEITEGNQLEQSDGLKREIGICYTDLGHVLTDAGDFAGARQAYEKALKICTQQQDERQMGVVNGQLGTLARREGDRQEAVKRYEAARNIFQGLNEPAMEAVAWHQLGIVYQESRQWEAAEQHYRRSATIEESRGNLQGAAQTWNRLAIVCKGAGKVTEAEDWFKKAIKVHREIGNSSEITIGLYNLANLLRNDSTRLPEARQLAEEALEIDKTLDPAAAEIWKTYGLLAEITKKQGVWSQSREYRRLARESQFAYAGTQYELKQFASVILGAVAGIKDGDVRQQFTDTSSDAEQRGYGNLVAAIKRIWQGERDAETLFERLDPMSALVVMAILEGIKNPESLQQFT